ncbi:wall-associated receptor kinase 5-like [Vitis riparia]|uniref:wall-associated receptor kinase 5-like n=1 Tax=Vitis riparia TaxID=96939 RepID=UPI00155ACA85|nr:wall-associated receptor kinase 5-like [Vitis riparia]
MSTWADGGDWPSNQCSLVLIAENNFSEFHQFDVSFSNVNKTYFYPSVLNWAIGNKSCHEAQKRGDYACGSNSRCVNSKKGSGYTCQCNSGYRGNPYLPDGCGDVDECMESNNTFCQKGAVCTNTNGSYYCDCPPGYYRDDDKPEYECVRDKGKHNPALLVSSGIAVTLVLLILLAISFWLNQKIEKRKKSKLKQMSFKKNGGLLLQREISSSSIGSSVEKTKLYTIEELEKATDNFNAGRVLGKGGHGKVYKGLLLDGSIVAIKKSIVVDERQVVEFINEVFILSQINHRHIVKLLGCCLESEVPLLVYEYVSNDTLSHHLHNEDHASTLSWEERLRIADEIAVALAYLHSYASTAILHRDIKSRNILLDENFRAVVSDFGLSRSIAHEKTHLSTLVQGTFGYLDPEYFRSGQFTDKSDVYGFGMILAELLTGEKVICSSRSEESLAIHFRLAMKQNFLFEILDKVIVNEGQEKEILAVAKIAKRCLKLSGKKRPAMKEIAADLHQLRRTMKQPSLKQTCQDNCPVSGRYSFSSASTSAVTEEYALQG